MEDVDWTASLRAELPLLEQCIYLNTGTAGPVPSRTADAVVRAVDQERTEGRGDFSRFDGVLRMRQRARELAARLLCASPDEIALTHHTSDGINIVLSGIDWHPGDVLVTTTLEHDAGAVPIGVLKRRYGVEVRFADVGHGQDALARLDEALSPRTKLVVLSHVVYSTGALLPVRALARLSHARGAAVLVDGAQTGGAMPIDVDDLDADFYTLSGQKWLCAPEGTGALYVRAEQIERLWPAFTSYFSVADHDFRGNVELQPTARRYETGMFHRPALAGFVTSLQWMIEQVGIDRAWRRSQELARILRTRLADLDEVVLVTPESHPSQLVSFDLPAFSPARLNALALIWSRDRRLIVRSIDHPPYALRASLGFFNTEADIDALVDATAHALHDGPGAIDPGDAWQPLPDSRP